MPRANIGDRADAVDAAVGPEVDQYDLALQLLRLERRAVDPRTELIERGQLSFDGEFEPSACADLRLRLLRATQPELLRNAGFQSVGLRARQFCQYPRVETERDGQHTGDDQRAKPAADPLGRMERALHPLIDLAAHEQGE